MLYNPNWKQPTLKPNKVLSLEDLILWLRQQNPEAEYTLSPYRCLLAQYLKAHKYRNVSCDYNYFISGWWPRKTEISNEIKSVIYNGDRTFGAALKRAESTLKTGSTYPW